MDLVPPLRYSFVEEGLFRGAYPLLRNFNFLRRLKLRTIISLIPEEPTKDLKAFCKTEGIAHTWVEADRFKGEPQLLHADLTTVLSVLLNEENYPIYIHCLDGRQTTGMCIMALRKLMCWDYQSMYDEFLRFAKEAGNELAFIVDYPADLQAPARLPRWLWPSFENGVTPSVKLPELTGKILSEQLTLDPIIFTKNDVYGSNTKNDEPSNTAVGSTGGGEDFGANFMMRRSRAVTSLMKRLAKSRQSFPAHLLLPNPSIPTREIRDTSEYTEYNGTTSYSSSSTVPFIVTQEPSEYYPPPLDYLIVDQATRARKHPLLRITFPHQSKTQHLALHQPAVSTKPKKGLVTAVNASAVDSVSTDPKTTITGALGSSPSSALTAIKKEAAGGIANSSSTSIVGNELAQSSPEPPMASSTKKGSAQPSSTPPTGAAGAIGKKQIAANRPPSGGMAAEGISVQGQMGEAGDRTPSENANNKSKEGQRLRAGSVGDRLLSSEIVSPTSPSAAYASQQQQQSAHRSFSSVASAIVFSTLPRDSFVAIVPSNNSSRTVKTKGLAVGAAAARGIVAASTRGGESLPKALPAAGAGALTLLSSPSIVAGANDNNFKGVQNATTVMRFFIDLTDLKPLMMRHPEARCVLSRTLERAVAAYNIALDVLTQGNPSYDKQFMVVSTAAYAPTLTTRLDDIHHSTSSTSAAVKSGSGTRGTPRAILKKTYSSFFGSRNAVAAAAPSSSVSAPLSPSSSASAMEGTANSAAFPTSTREEPPSPVPSSLVRGASWVLQRTVAGHPTTRTSDRSVDRTPSAPDFDRLAAGAKANTMSTAAIEVGGRGVGERIGSVDYMYLESQSQEGSAIAIGEEIVSGAEDATTTTTRWGGGGGGSATFMRGVGGGGQRVLPSSTVSVDRMDITTYNYNNDSVFSGDASFSGAVTDSTPLTARVGHSFSHPRRQPTEPNSEKQQQEQRLIQEQQDQDDKEGNPLLESARSKSVRRGGQRSTVVLDQQPNTHSLQQQLHTPSVRDFLVGLAPSVPIQSMLPLEDNPLFAVPTSSTALSSASAKETVISGTTLGTAAAGGAATPTVTNMNATLGTTATNVQIESSSSSHTGSHTAAALFKSHQAALLAYNKQKQQQQQQIASQSTNRSTQQLSNRLSSVDTATVRKALVGSAASSRDGAGAGSSSSTSAQASSSSMQPNPSAINASNFKLYPSPASASSNGYSAKSSCCDHLQTWRGLDAPASIFRYSLRTTMLHQDILELMIDPLRKVEESTKSKLQNADSTHSTQHQQQQRNNSNNTAANSNNNNNNNAQNKSSKANGGGFGGGVNVSPVNALPPTAAAAAAANQKQQHSNEPSAASIYGHTGIRKGGEGNAREKHGRNKNLSSLSTMPLLLSSHFRHTPSAAKYFRGDEEKHASFQQRSASR